MSGNVYSYLFPILFLSPELLPSQDSDILQSSTKTVYRENQGDPTNWDQKGLSVFEEEMFLHGRRWDL